ncbi:MAG: Omp28-related outer membrane protein [Candidatus Kapabacteria bacterium]|nr:Omp28-related outer membrane protein [Candidatus Kapabacteria bacterium]
MKFRTMLAAVATLVLLAVHIQAQTKRVVLEEFTGAWCGWCVDGFVKMDAIKKKQGDKVIVLTVHQGDSMQIPASAPLLSFVSGYPSGAVDRTPVGGTLALDRGQWDAAVSDRLTVQAPVGIQIVKSEVDQNGGFIRVKVKADFTSAVDGPTRMNVWVIEDSLSGPNITGWNQRNFIANNSQFVGHPYYSKPDPIVGFVHRHVLRGYAAGAWGAEGITPQTGVNAGESYTTSFHIPLDPRWNTKRISLVAVVTRHDGADASQREILNAIEEPLGGVNTNGAVSVQSTPSIALAGKDENGEMPLTITNKTNNPMTYVFAAKKSLDAPAGWKATVKEGNEVTVPANGTSTVTLQLSPDAKIAIAGASMTMAEKGNPDMTYPVSPLVVLHKNVESLEFGFSGQLTSAIKQAGRNDEQYLYIGEQYLNAYTAMNNMPNLKNIILNFGYGAQVNATIVTGMRQQWNRGVNVMVIGSEPTFGTISSVSSAAYNDLGVGYLGRCWVGQGSGNATFIGYNTNDISKGFSSAATFQYYNSKFRITNGTVAKALLRPSAFDSTIAFNSTLSKSRVIFMPTPEMFSNAQQVNGLFKKALDWLEGAGAAPSAGIEVTAEGSSDNTINYGTMKINQTKTMTANLKNTGNGDLIITGVDFGSDANIFSIVSGGTFPATVKPGQTLALGIQAKLLKAEDVLSSATVQSNAKSGDGIIGLIITADMVNSVEPGTSGDGVLSVGVYPTPAASDATVKYSVNGNAPSQVNIRITDVLGNTVSVLRNEVSAPGSHTVPVNASALAAGSYRVVISTGTSSTFAPLVIVK